MRYKQTNKGDKLTLIFTKLYNPIDSFMRLSSFVAKSLGFKFSRTFHLRKYTKIEKTFTKISKCFFFTKQDYLVKISTGHENYAYIMKTLFSRKF